MKRRGFIKGLLGALGVATAAPVVAKLPEVKAVAQPTFEAVWPKTKLVVTQTPLGDNAFQEMYRKEFVNGFRRKHLESCMAVINDRIDEDIHNGLSVQSKFN